MRGRRFLTAVLRAVVLSGMCASAQSQSPAQPLAGSPAVPGAAQSALFTKPVTLRGTLGDAQVQLNLRPKAAVDEGLEGDYFLFGSAQKVLLAGETEGDDLFLEESENGKDVSGHWTGSMKGDTISGNWSSADGAVEKAFQLRLVPAAEQGRRVRQDSKR